MSCCLRRFRSERKVREVNWRVQFKASIWLLFTVATLIEAEKKVQRPNGSSCPNELATFEPINTNRTYENLVQFSINTVQSKLPTSNSTSSSSNKELSSSNPINRQIAFESVCNGWQNVIELDGLANLNSRPIGYWVLDGNRRALVAKLSYYDRKFSESRVARLLSPTFHPIPAYHSMTDSRYYATCRVTFRAYLTMPAHLDLNLITVPIVSSPVRANYNNYVIQNSQQVINLRSVEEGYSPRGKALADKAGETAAWIDYNATLPIMNKEENYKLEFVATSAPIKSGATQISPYLNGVAIANISLSPQCFGLDVDQDELDRVRTLTGQDISSLAELATVQPETDPVISGNELSIYGLMKRFIEAYTTQIVMIILIVICFLLPILCIIGYLGCGPQYERKKPKTIWARLCCCLRCCFESSNRRRRIYAAAAAAADGNTKLNGDQDQVRAYLRPLTNVLENVELNENPNYMANGTQRGQSAGWKSESGPLEPHQLDRKRLTLTKKLGKGAFGEVYQGYLVCYCSGDSADNSTTAHRFSADDDNQLETHSIKVAVKTLTDERMSQSDFIREAVNMSLVKHRNIVELIGVCFEEKPLYIVMELLPGGNLKNFLLKNRDRGYYQQVLPIQLASPPPPQSDVTSTTQSTSLWSLNVPQHPAQQVHHPPTTNQEPRVKLCMGDLLVFALDIARACDYLQKHQFIHRDLAARNCLLTIGSKLPSSIRDETTMNQRDTRAAQGKTFVGTSAPSALDVNANHKVDLNQVFLNGYMNSSIVAKLADFGMTRDVYSNDYYRMGHKEMPVRWMPPECLDGVATTKSDVWSFGVFLWELFSMGQMPYQNLLNNHQVIEFIKSRRHAKPRTSSGQKNNEELLLTISAENVSLTRSSSDKDDLLLLETDANEAAELPPLPPPHDNTPLPIYSIMCSCWASNPEERPQFEEIANRLYWCLQMPKVLETSLPCFYEQHTPGNRSESRNSAATQLNWWCP